MFVHSTTADVTDTEIAPTIPRLMHTTEELRQMSDGAEVIVDATAILRLQPFVAGTDRGASRVINLADGVTLLGEGTVYRAFSVCIASLRGRVTGGRCR